MEAGSVVVLDCALAEFAMPNWAAAAVTAAAPTK
jgi:hypothetical protein